MKKLIAIAGCSLALQVNADVVTKDLAVCTTMEYFVQANTAQDRNDFRAMRYLLNEGYCFQLKTGTEYSVIEINYPKDPAEWAKLRVYVEDDTVEVYSWYGFVE